MRARWSFKGTMVHAVCSVPTTQPMELFRNNQDAAVMPAIKPRSHCGMCHLHANTFLTPLIDANSICCTNCWPPQQEKRTAEHTPGISEPEAALNIHSPMKLVH
eukprot:GHRR01023227.1.p2 GENE.GHRR01023227.1~~GHRR01023227.1.p2  ORF type:complete len:104 (+),score=5.24 GHRR01023227.1:514-825(+)